MTEPTKPTSEKLADALREAGAPEPMITKAREGYYDDFRSPLPMPELQLMADARALGLTRIVEGVLRGEWDATPAESEAWMQSPEGQETMRLLLRPRGRHR